ncbi:GNAT family N-acetyltransferase [Candidatus Parabeggiatoa sp. HSG14]|uniref:GNAT family N-acetyltransferase n=1 Tax=Candidatus Parabeggiatoa sp. HSG14 TaxID=3055593 RepID=UPI0025A7856A|nr:GNAT family N-acetyltransferase [Thiotrichales bacterium HSG14]
MPIKFAEIDEDIESCYSVMVQLRPHLSQSEFIQRVKRQMQDGYKLAFLESKTGICAVAGFRISENLAWGKFLYLDDFVSDENHRSKGSGKQFFSWLIDYGHAQGCKQFHLDSGVQRFLAHKFYFREGMKIMSYHFSMEL